MYADELASISALKVCVTELGTYFGDDFPKELYTLTAPTSKAVDVLEKKLAAAKKSGSAFVVASGAALAAFALF